MDEHLLRYDKDKELVFIDFETENLCLHDFKNIPWQVALIKTKGGIKTDERDYYIEWDRKLSVSPQAAMITKFSYSTYKSKAIPYREIFPTIEDWLENCDHIVGHNILGFDMYLIKNYYEAMGKSYQHLVEKTIDTYCLSKAMKLDIQHKPEMESLLEFQYKLINLKKRGIKTNLKQMGIDFGIEHDYDNLHNALADLELNLKVWNKLKWAVEV